MKRTILLALMTSMVAVADDRFASDVELPRSYFYIDCEYSPDGALFAMAGADIQICDVAKRTLQRTIPCDGLPLTIEFTRDSSKIAAITCLPQVVDKRYSLVVYDVATGKELHSFPLQDYKSCDNYELKISPDGKLFAYRVEDTIVVVDESGKKVWDWTAEGGDCGQRSGGFDVTDDWSYFLLKLQRVSYPAKEVLPMVTPNFKEGGTFVHAAIISNDGRKAAVLGDGNGVTLNYMDLVEGTVLKTYDTEGAFEIRATPKFDFIVTENSVFKVSGEEPIHVKPQLNYSPSNCLALNPAAGEVTVGDRYYSIADAAKIKSRDDCAGVWPSRSELTYEFGETPGVLIVKTQFGRKGFALEGMTKVELPKIKSPHGLPYVPSPCGAYAVNRRGELIDPKDPEKAGKEFLPSEALEKMSEHFNPNVTFNREGQLVFRSSSGKLYLYDAKNEKMLASFMLEVSDDHATLHTQDDITLASDGRHVSSEKNHHGAYRQYVCNAEGETVLGPFKYQQECFVIPCASGFTPDASCYILASGKTVKIFETDSWKPKCNLELSVGWVRSFSVSPDSRRLLVNDGYGRGLIYDMVSGQLSSTIIGRDEGGIAIFGEDGVLDSHHGNVESFFE